MNRAVNKKNSVTIMAAPTGEGKQQHFTVY